MVDRAEGRRNLFALQRLQIFRINARTFARNNRHGRIRTKLMRVAGIIAECDEIHAAQNSANHRHADLHHFCFARLQRVERINACCIRPRDHDIEAPFFKKAALQRNGQTNLVNARHHAGFELHDIALRAQRERRHGHRRP